MVASFIGGENRGLERGSGLPKITPLLISRARTCAPISFFFL